MEPDFTFFNSTVLLKSQADDFVRRLTRLQEELHSSIKDFNRLLEQYLTFEEKETLLKLFLVNEVDIRSTEQIDTFITTVSLYYSKLPVVDIILPFNPSKNFLLKVAAWLKEELRKESIINLVVDNHLLAGLKVGYNGVFKDFTLRKALDQKFPNSDLRAESSKP